MKKPVQIETVQPVQGIMFVKVMETCTTTARILLPSTSRFGRRPLTRTDVLEELMARRNSMYEQCLRQLEPEDLGLDPGLPARKPSLVSLIALPQVVAVDGPDMFEVKGVAIRMLMGTGRNPLWVELSVSTIEYLAAAVQAQLSRGGTKRAADGQEDSPAGKHIKFDAKRALCRVSIKHQGKRVRKRFKVEAGNVQDARTAALDIIHRECTM